MTQEENIIDWSERVLQYLLDKKKVTPDLRFWVRRQNKKNRLDKGQWFQGNDRYIFIGFSNRTGGNLSTRSIGFVIGFDDKFEYTTALQFVFRNEHDEKVKEAYQLMIDQIGGLTKQHENEFIKPYASADVFADLDTFLTEHKPIIDRVIEETGLKKQLAIDEKDFEKSIQKIMEKRKTNTQTETALKMLLVNITWNSKNWTEPTIEKSTHRYVAEGGQPHESWNFDFDNPRNTSDRIYGFSQFTNNPKVSGQNNLIIFYSQGFIVGFYGKAEIFDKVNPDSEQSYNLSGDKELSLVLKNKIENIKEKGYLEDLTRVGQIGFSYLQSADNVLHIFDEAIELNPEQAEKLNAIKDWLRGTFPEPRDKQWNKLVRIVSKINNPNAVRKFFTLTKGVLEVNHLEEEDERYYCAVRPEKNRIHLTLGTRYTVVLEGVGKKAKIGMYIGKNDLEKLQTNFDGEAETEIFKQNEQIIGYYASVNADKIIPADWLDKIIAASEIELRQEKSQHRNRGKHNPWIYRTAFDDQLLEDLLGENTIIIDDDKNTTMKEYQLNQIFFGPPGTGKTYSTINEAVRIVEELTELELNEKYKTREELKAAFKNYLEEDEPHIGFCTFHQSFSYEDFVEGIKPLEFKAEDTFLKYETQPGIFKNMCDRADGWNKIESDVPIGSSGFMELSLKELKQTTFYKMSLGDSNSEDDKEIYEYCIKENMVSIGWGDLIDVTSIESEQDITKTLKDDGQPEIAGRYLSYFKLYMKMGNYVIISNGNTRIRAIGRVTGEYEFVEDSPIRYHHFRPVKWILKDVDIPVKEFYEKLFQQQTIYKLNSQFIKPKFFISKDQEIKNNGKEDVKRNHVLIIDEINRGNISQIFGELITLIEKDKRKGKEEELQVILPYSKKKFYVPSNLFIIGTMNTADRSIEALDTALRRRFSFKEIAPNSSLLAEKGKSVKNDGVVDEINLLELLDTINDRIEKLLDKDHKIGHSYFMQVDSYASLVNAFRNKVIPLLEEYFYGDFGKIGLVLGNEFVNIKAGNPNEFSFAKFTHYDNDVITDLKERKIYEITDHEDWSIYSFQSIYSKTKV